MAQFSVRHRSIFRFPLAPPFLDTVSICFHRQRDSGFLFPDHYRLIDGKIHLFGAEGSCGRHEGGGQVVRLLGKEKASA